MNSNCSTSPANKDDNDIPTTEEIIRRFQCVKCTRLMQPKIMQCTAGHNYCKLCFEDMVGCSACKANVPFVRNVVLEELFFKVKLPCRNTYFGCDFRAKPREMNDHDPICFFQLRLCPFNFFCEWIGQFWEIREHCKDEHISYICTNPVTLKGFRGFKYNRCGLHIFVVFAYKAIFSVTINMNLKAESLECATYCIGQEDQRKNFCWEIHFLKKYEKGIDEDMVIGYVCKSNCIYSENNINLQVDSQLSVAPFQIVDDLCNSEGSLYFLINIIDSDKSYNSEQSTHSSEAKRWRFKCLENFFSNIFFK